MIQPRGESTVVVATTVPTLRGRLGLAVPVMLSNAMVPLVGFVDAAVVGQLGVAHLIGGRLCVRQRA